MRKFYKWVPLKAFIRGFKMPDEEVGGEEIYSDKGREKMLEDDEIEPWEEGFMEGAEGGGEKAKCANCGKVLEQDSMNIIEKEIDNELKWFCSEDCVEKYEKKKLKKK